MYFSLTINHTTVEVNGARVWIETPSREIYASRGTACPSVKENPSDGTRVREGFGWFVLSCPKG